MSSSTFPITGLQGGRGPTGSVPIRHEINQFTNPLVNPYAKTQLNLFLQAMERIQAAPRTDLLSWFQIAGIHGQPFADWDGSKGTVDPGDNKQWLGYCTHASILFPTWHRVYCALVEQAIHSYMKEIVAEFPSDQQLALQPALDHWRLPYWDWALIRPGSTKLSVPELLRTVKVDVQRPTGLTESIDNPLYRFKFPLNSEQKIDGITDASSDDPTDPYSPFSQSPYTVRHPTLYDQAKPFSEQTSWAQGISDNNDVDLLLNNGIPPKRPGGRALVGEVYALTVSRDYPPFSNMRWNPAAQTAEGYKSLEAVHNNVHVFIGGKTMGHMSANEVAAFDPIFWMHHCNIDRLLSIFQALNPADYKDWPNDKWLSQTIEPWFSGKSEIDSEGTWTAPHGEVAETTTTPLTPFHTDTNGTYWTSDGCRDMKALGYSYLELQDWLPIFHDASGKFNEPLFCDAVKLSAKVKYEWAAPTLLRLRQLGLVHGSAEEAQTTKHALSEIAGNVLKSTVHPFEVPLYYANVPKDELQFNEYVVNVRVDRFAASGRTFTVEIFLGAVPEDVSTWDASPERVGVVTIFGGAMYSSGKCSNCNKQAEQDETRLVTGQTSITNSLLDIIEDNEPVSGVRLKNLEREHVGDFLRKALHWRVVVAGVGGALAYDVKDVPSLKVSVAVCTATLPSHESDFIEYGDFEILDTATRGRLAGFDLKMDVL